MLKTMSSCWYFQVHMFTPVFSLSIYVITFSTNEKPNFHTSSDIYLCDQPHFMQPTYYSHLPPSPHRCPPFLLGLWFSGVDTFSPGAGWFLHARLPAIPEWMFSSTFFGSDILLRATAAPPTCSVSLNSIKTELFKKGKKYHSIFAT